MSLFAAVHFIHSNGDFTTGFCVLELLRKFSTPVPMYIYFSVILYYNITKANGIYVLFEMSDVITLYQTGDCSRPTTAII